MPKPISEEERKRAEQELDEFAKKVREGKPVPLANPDKFDPYHGAPEGWEPPAPDERPARKPK